MDLDSYPPRPPDPVCVRCSKPVRDGFLVSPTGEVSHIRCRTREFQLIALEEQDRARRAIERATKLVEETTHRRQRAQPRRQVIPLRSCPVCNGSATLINWWPTLDWLAVEGCGCQGFFVWTPLLDDGRLARLSLDDRATLSQRIRAKHATRSDVWLSTRDGTVKGALILRDERPDRPT